MRGAELSFPTYHQYTTAVLLNAYAQGPDRLASVIAGLTDAELRVRARGEGTWSVHEILIHTADSEIQGAYRIRKVLAEPGADLPGYNQDAWTRELAYQRQPASARDTALAVLHALRRMVIPVLHSATPGQWEQTGNHPEYGALTLRNLLELYADHTERHIAQILVIRDLLGRPLRFPLLLPDRLY